MDRVRRAHGSALATAGTTLRVDARFEIRHATDRVIQAGIQASAAGHSLPGEAFTAVQADRAQRRLPCFGLFRGQPQATATGEIITRQKRAPRG